MMEMRMLRLATDYYDQDMKENVTSIVNPTWDQIERAVISLDGINKTNVWIASNDEEGKFLIIGGCWHGG
jgi:hypothetical protein